MSMEAVNKARKAILEDLKRRYKEKDPAVKASFDTSRFSHPQDNYFTGSGIMDCPICIKGKLQYVRSSHNGHVHAACSDVSCVGWME